MSRGVEKGQSDRMGTPFEDGRISIHDFSIGMSNVLFLLTRTGLNPQTSVGNDVFSMFLYGLFPAPGAANPNAPMCGEPTVPVRSRVPRIERHGGIERRDPPTWWDMVKKHKEATTGMETLDCHTKGNT